jgi:signal transduction histidine kinase
MQTELAWLLAQEARSAARKLRQGVGILPTEEDSPATFIEEGSGGVESTLNRLDEAVSALASLHGSAMPRGRRGKVDIAALVWEVAPEASVQIEMGEGTTAFGDEAELRRMLQVLIGQSGPPTSSKGGPDISIRREGDDILVHVGLGSENPATFATERAWLARMATRYGGSIKLDGSSHTLVLPADVDMQRRELESLKKELAAAQAQGQAYARELAAVFARGETHSGSGAPSARSSPSQHPTGTGDGLAVLVAAARTLAAELRGLLAAIGRDIAPLREASGEAGDIAASVGRHVTGASELVADLARLGACPVGELPRHVDVAAVLREVVTAQASRAERHDVRVTVTAHQPAPAIVPAGAMAVLLQALVDHAIDASPPGSEVAVSITDEPDSISILFDDAGPPLPAHSKSVILSRDFEAIAQGRSAGLDLVTAYAVAAHLALPIELEESPQRGARIRIILPKST